MDIPSCAALHVDNNGLRQKINNKRLKRVDGAVGVETLQEVEISKDQQYTKEGEKL